MHDGVNVGYIDKQEPIDAHAAFWLPHGAPLVGNVAALAAHKGQRHLVAAAARVVRELPDARFLIVGEGELRETLERQIKEPGARTARPAGRVPTRRARADEVVRCVRDELRHRRPRVG